MTLIELGELGSTYFVLGAPSDTTRHDNDLSKDTKRGQSSEVLMGEKELVKVRAMIKEFWGKK